MENNNDLLEKIAVFLIVLVGIILIFSQYQFFKLTGGNVMIYLTTLLILTLVALVAYLVLNKDEEEHHKSNHTKHQAPKPWTDMEKVSFGLVALVGVIILFNQVQISQASALGGFSSNKLSLKSTSTKTSLALTGDPIQDAMTIMIPTGTPFYGDELGVTFDDPITGLSRIAELDPAYGRAKINLNEEDNARYIKINTIPTVTCEFCCGVKTGVTSNGRPTCGCKHAWATRGLSAYLIQSYPDLTDEEIVREVAKWKSLFFPKQMIGRYIEQTQSGEYTADVASILMDLDEEKLSESRQSVASSGHGDSSGGPAALPSSLDDLPNMVGGC